MATQDYHPLPLPPAQQQQQPDGQYYQNQYYQYQQPQQQQQYQPAQPQQPQQFRQQPARPQQNPPKSKPRSFSFHSEKSHKSSGSRKIDLHETSAEKEAKRLHSKADPTLAMNEAEPSAVQAQVKSSLAPLRAIQHKDPFGNPIAEPDRSNPTRSRWERPLDTIRSFEAAIDGYSNSDVPTAANWNRRSSYYGSNGPRFPQESYYGSRPPSTFEMGQNGRGSYLEGQQQHNGGGYGYGPGPNRQRAMRMQSEPHFNYAREQSSVYPLQHKDRSYETVTSAAGSGSSGENGSYRTDPSSENSSIERASPSKPAPAQPVNDYGIGFSQSPTYQPPAFTIGTNQSVLTKKPVPNGYINGPPPVPQKDQSVARRPVPQQQPQRPELEKRKSWFARRFSKAT